MKPLGSPLTLFAFNHLFKSALSCILMVGFTSLALSQSHHFKTLGIAEGLLSLKTESLVQDGLGFIWVSTAAGLSRYDGKTFRHYHSHVDDSTSLMHKSPESLFVDRHGQLWVSMEQGGLARYLPESDGFLNYPWAVADSGEVRLASVDYFHTDHNGQMVVVTSDYATYRYDEVDDKFLKHTPWANLPSDKERPVRPVLFGSDSLVWLLSSEGGDQFLSAYGDSKATHHVRLTGFVNCAVEAPRGVIWVGTWGYGLYRYDTRKNQLANFSIYESLISPPGSIVEDLQVDAEGNLWMATDKGPAFVPADLLTDAERVDFTRPVNSATGLPVSDSFKDIESDDNGQLWFASDGDGVYVHDPASVPYELIALADSISSEGTAVNDLYHLEDEFGRLWFPLNESVFCYDPSSGRQVEVNLSCSGSDGSGWNSILRLSLAADGRVMVSYRFGKPILVDTETFETECFDNSPKTRVPSGVLYSFRDSRGALWLSTYEGILRHPGDDISVFDTIVAGIDAREILEGADGAIWVGSRNEGVLRIDPNSMEAKRYDPSSDLGTGLMGSDAKSIKMGKGGKIWAMTSRGLNHYDPEEDRFQFVEPTENFELQLTEYFSPDGQGNFWFSSLKGLYLWKFAERKVMFVDSDYGLPQTEFYEINTTSDGELYVNTGLGCIHFDPAVVPDPVSPTAVTFTSLLWRSEDTSRHQSLIGVPNFELSHKDNYAEITFAPLNFDSHGELAFEYLLEGGSGVWVDIGDETVISFLDLSAGNYSLQVRGRNDWSERGPASAIDFSVAPPWWYSKTAIAAYFLLGVLGVVLYTRLRTNHLRRRQKLLELVVDERTEEIRLERDRSDSLLLNILPGEVAEELKNNGHAEAKKINEVTVLFTDFKGFTTYSEKVSPEGLVEDLHESFTAFDRIMAKHGVEKIKTIGDAYMAAGGLPTPNDSHARDVLAAAFEIRDFIEIGKAKKIRNGLPYFDIRIGVHTGPVVAGIVGVKKFSYDIWGDTVNTASRMESSGEEGKVNISKSTHELVRDLGLYTFEPRGKIKAKGKGEMEMFFAEEVGSG